MNFYKNMRIRQKMLVFILSFITIIYLVSFGFIIFDVRQKSFDEAEQLTMAQTREYANLIRANINYDFDLSRGLGYALQNFSDLPAENFDEIVKPILREYLVRNPNFYSVWASFELNALLPDYYMPYGRVRYTWVRQNDNIIFQQDTLNVFGDDEGSLYWQIKQSKEETMTDPYWYSYSDNPDDKVLEVSPCIPLLINGNFAGLAGTDIILERFQQIIQEADPFDVGYALLLSNDGSYLAYPDEAALGEKISDLRQEYDSQYQVTERISRGEFFSHYFFNQVIGETAFVAYAPIAIGDTDTPWSLAIVLPRSHIVAEANQMVMRSIIVALLGLLILSYIIFLIAGNITRPLASTIDTLHTIARGDITNARQLEVKNHDEIGEMAIALNKLLAGLRNTAEFARKIGEGRLDEKFEKLSEQDLLGNALLAMRSSLSQAKEEELIRKNEDEKRNWASQGFAQFADILRLDNDNLEELSFNLIKNLVKYLDANQGGLFILNNDNPNDPFLELTACYAYDRRKYLQKKINIGEGLLGACFLEKQYIYLTDIPQDYVRITSGLGNENPASLLIVPLLLNDEVLGVVELASFRPFEQHQIQFIEKVTENIASTISGVKINVNTAFLLEQSQQQAEEMKAQEEEMRQNMEEMAATQEEMARKDQAIKAHQETSETILCVMEYDQHGNILNVNRNFEIVSGYSEQEVKGKHISIFFDNPNWQQSENYAKFWSLLKQGNAVKGTLRRKRKDGSFFFVKGTSKMAKDDFGSYNKVVEITIDITHELQNSK